MLEIKLELYLTSLIFSFLITEGAQVSSLPFSGVFLAIATITVYQLRKLKIKDMLNSVSQTF